MPIAVGVTLLVAGEPVDPADLIAAVSASTLAVRIRVDRSGRAVWFTAADRPVLAELAAPVLAWWQRQGPAAVLRLADPAGINQISCPTTNRGVPLLARLITTAAGPIPERDTGVPTGRRRSIGALRRHGGFVARVVAVTEDNGIVCVGLAEQADGTGRSLILQAVDPASSPSDLLDDDAGYCLVTQTGATTYGGITRIELHGTRLRIGLSRPAADQLELPTLLTIALHVGDQAIENLRDTMRRIFSVSADPHPAPQLELG